MPLASGSRFGPYEIHSAIGEGGMGEVFRARDTKLAREVALKILPDAFAVDPDRLARFGREAQVLASLNHPNIASIYGVEDSPQVAGGPPVRALVMELVEGPTLADRIGQGAIPLDEALPIASQIADALAAAHDQGIVHRDLKPANVKVRPDGTVKVLDFGLAKALDSPLSGASSEPAAMSPTISLRATQAGVVLGTAAYMSPEQAKGRPVDRRTDLWAFGAVLYEMLTAKRAFGGEDISDTIVALLRDAPDWTALPADTPDAIRRLLRRCLEKERKKRIDSAADARLEIDEAIAMPVPSAEPARTAADRGSRRRLPALAAVALTAGAALAAAAVTWVVMRPAPPQPLSQTRFTIKMPAEQLLDFLGNPNIAIAPDGTRIVYVVRIRGQRQMVVRALDGLEATPLPGISGVQPFFSPDGRWIGYLSANELRKVSTTGGPPITLWKGGADGGLGFGATWGRDATIVFHKSGAGLMRIPDDGGDAKPLTTLRPGETGHRFPVLLPGERAVLFTIAKGGGLQNAEIAALDLRSGVIKTLIRGGSDARYVDTGHLIYAAGSALRVVRFDLERLEVAGDPFALFDRVATSPAGHALAALAQNGTMVYVPDDLLSAAPSRSLVWVSRQGREDPIQAPPREYAVARLSPDGSRLALDVRDGNNDIWIWDVARRTMTPLNLHPAQDMSPVWTPDGRYIIWASTRAEGNPNLYRQLADGTGAVERISTSLPAQFPTSMSPDGKALAMFTTTSPTSLAVLTMEGPQQSGPATGSSRSLLNSTGTLFGAEISPDGRWLAYQSDESGQFQVYVRPYPAVDTGRWQISPQGGSRPAWAKSGRELFYLDAANMLTGVSIQPTAASLGAGTPVRILDRAYYTGSTARGFDLRAYDVSPDGQRFLMIEDAAADAPNDTPARLVVVLNWIEELKARAAPAR